MPMPADQQATSMLADFANLTAFIRHISGTGEVVGYVFAFAARRRFALEPDVGVITRYVRRVHSQDSGDVDGERLRKAEAVVRAALGEPWLTDDLKPADVGATALPMLRDLAESGFVTPAQLDELIAAAEDHRRLFGGGSVRGRRWLVGRRAESTASGGERSSVVETWQLPRSVAGRWLRGLVIAGGANRARQPVGLADDLAVLEAAFEIAVAQRFAPGYGVHTITRCIYNVNTRFPKAKLRVRDAEALVRRELGERVAIEDIDGYTARRTRLLVTAVMLNDLGLLREELDALLIDAEARAAERGFTPQLATT